MMTLAPKIGRQNAHDLVHAAADIAQRQGASLFDLLMADDTVRANVSESDLRAALDPTNYTGCSAEIARACAALARTTATRLTSE